MDLQLVEPDEIPLPPGEVRIRSIEVSPESDGKRVRVSVQLTPFLEPPTISLAIATPDGEVVSEATVVEADHPRLHLTMHLRTAPVVGRYALRGSLMYGSDPAQDVREFSFSLREA